MSGMHDAAKDALRALLAELPSEFSDKPRTDDLRTRLSFQVIKKRNVRAVHEALWTLQEYFGMTEE